MICLHSSVRVGASLNPSILCLLGDLLQFSVSLSRIPGRLFCNRLEFYRASFCCIDALLFFASELLAELLVFFFGLGHISFFFLLSLLLFTHESLFPDCVLDSQLCVFILRGVRWNHLISLSPSSWRPPSPLHTVRPLALLPTQCTQRAVAAPS